MNTLVRSHKALVLCRLLVLMVLGWAAALAQASNVWQYRVLNASDTIGYGLNTNNVRYTPKCIVTASQSCAGEAFFAFQDGVLTVDFDNGTASLRGKAKAAKLTNPMLWDLQVDFSDMSACSDADLRPSLRWPWGKTIPGLTPADPPVDDPVKNVWHCFRTISGFVKDTLTGDEVHPVGAGYPLQLGIGANTVLRETSGGFVKFTTDAGGTGFWSLTMQLDHGFKIPDPPQPKQFQIVFCPSDSETDPGDPDIDGTAGRSDCSLDWYDDGSFLTTINGEDALRGIVTLDGLLEITDPRAQCGYTGTDPLPSYMELRDPDGDGRMALRLHLATGDLEVPQYLCGIPDVAGVPRIKIIDINADFWSDPSFVGVRNSVIDHEIINPANTDYACDKLPIFQPVAGWQPRVGEIPVLDANGQKVYVVRDVTNACGSYRGGTSRLSYLLSNLVYAPYLGPQDFHRLIANEIDALEDTTVLSTTCVHAKRSILAILFPDLNGARGQSRYLDHVTSNFASGNYRQTLSRLNWLLNELLPGGRLADAYTQCYANSEGAVIDVASGAPVPAGYQPRNFRGDLEAQVRHIIYNIESKQPAKP